MSELKTYQRYSPSLIGLADYYLKSEADKVIAELQSKITLASLADDCSSLRHKRCNYCSELQRQKYKRCLAMALLWFERAENSTDWENELVSRKRFSKWMELAEHFKPNSTAR